MRPTRDAAALRAALLRERQLQRVQRVRRAAHGQAAGLRHRRRHARAGTTRRRSTRSIRTVRPVRRPRSPSTIRTSRIARCAARRCCAGSTGPARRCSSSGRSSASGSDSFGDFDFRRDARRAARRPAGQRVPGQGDVLVGTVIAARGPRLAGRALLFGSGARADLARRSTTKWSRVGRERSDPRTRRAQTAEQRSCDATSRTG